MLGTRTAARRGGSSVTTAPNTTIRVPHQIHDTSGLSIRRTLAQRPCPSEAVSTR